MKKYIKPVAQAINIDNEVILAGSDTLERSGNSVNAGDARSKHGAFGFDYEDED